MPDPFLNLHPLAGLARGRGDEYVRCLTRFSTKTISDYVGLLERMDAALVVPALAEHTHGAAPKKARKVFFADPFIHRAADAFVGRDGPEPGSDAHLQRDLEAPVAAHVARTAPVFYVKGKGEVDAAWYRGRALHLVEVKWSAQIRPEELKEIRGRGVVAARGGRETAIDGVRVLPAVVVLLRLSGAR